VGQPAARIGDMHVCPLQTPGVPPIPHVGGPITGPGAPTVLIGGMPAAVVGDMAICTGPPDSIIKGSSGVMICGKPAARMGDSCTHGGTIVLGCPTVLIGEVSPGGPMGGSPAVASAAPAAASSGGTQSSSSPASGQTASASSPNTPAVVARPSAAQSSKTKNAWIEIEMVDDDGNPLSGERYIIELPDGSKKSGMLDMDGRLKLKDIVAGKCKIDFPDRKLKTHF
jgi:uncharacterized Zn-binding protein involved in type VI secretion